MLQAGKRRHFVTIQRLSVDLDEYGEEEREPFTVTQLWAWVQVLDGSERFDAEQVNAGITHRVRLPHQRTVNILPQMQVKYPDLQQSPVVDRILDILAPLRDEKGFYTTLLCKERPGSAGGQTVFWQRYSLTEATISGIANGINTIFTVPIIPNEKKCLVIFNGNVLSELDFTLSGSTFTLSLAPKPASPGFPADTLEIFC